MSAGTVNQCDCIGYFNWDSTNYQCVVDCTLINYATSLAPSTTDTCSCLTNFIWDMSQHLCVINCASIPNAVSV